MQKITLYIFFVFFAITASAQTIKGKIIDATTNQTLPFVSVLVKNTQTGTLTDIDGKFQLKPPPTPPKGELQISYLGYQPQTIALSSFQDLEKITIKLKPQAISLQEVSVKAGENPAHRIIKNAIKNRDKNNPEKMRSFTYNSYTKFFVTADVKANIDSVSTQDTTLSATDKFFKKQHLLLIESVTKREFLHPDKNHEIVLASRVSGLKNSPFALLATQLQSFS
ncbi:MAG TPA: carboxypeptidase-like regulatory domain-containing protein, partial [Bacteroidia bacterium]